VVWSAAVGAKAIAVCCVGHINTQKTMLAAASAQTKPVTQGITKLREGLC
jgi:3-keto-L-gulonate-6-phosphate decarboxylase